MSQSSGFIAIALLASKHASYRKKYNFSEDRHLTYLQKVFCEHSLICILSPGIRSWPFLQSRDVVNYLNLLWLLVCLKVLCSLLCADLLCQCAKHPWSLPRRQSLFQRLDQWMWKAEKSVSSGGKGLASGLLVWLWGWYLINLCPPHILLWSGQHEGNIMMRLFTPVNHPGLDSMWFLAKYHFK